MTFALLYEQLLNGLQYGVMLFLMAAGLTLVFGIMNLVNLAHGSLYMVGAYLTIAAAQWTGNYLAGAVLGLAGTQVLATFGLILFFNELVAMIWGRAALFAALPGWFNGHVELFGGARYPSYR